jgi:hypothetical protein
MPTRSVTTHISERLSILCLLELEWNSNIEPMYPGLGFLAAKYKVSIRLGSIVALRQG